MNETIAIIASLLVVIGIIGSVLPILPGPPLVWLAIILLQWKGMAHFSTTFLIVTAVITLVVELLDYFLPIWMTKKAGGSKWGQRGAIVGLVTGIIVGGPFGLIFGPVAGAMVGELLHNRQDTRKAVRAGLFSFIGFLLTTGIALVWSGYLAWQVIKAIKHAGISVFSF